MLVNPEPTPPATVKYDGLALENRAPALLCGEVGANGMSEDGGIP